MAMTHLQPAVLLLLTSLFFLPALHGAIDFEYCAGEYGYDNVNVTNVSRIEISFNPPVGSDESSSSITIYLYGVASKDITMGTTVNVYLKYWEHYTRLRAYNIYEVCNIHGPIEAGTNFVLTLPYIPWRSFEKKLEYSVLFRQEDADEPTMNMCVDFDVPTSAPMLVSA